MSISLTPVPHARPTSKPPSPVRPALKLAVRLNPDGSPLVLPPGHRDDGRDKHAHGGARRLIPLIHPPRPLLAPRADVRGYHSVCNSTLTVAATRVRDFRRRRRRSESAAPTMSRWNAPGRCHRSCGCRCAFKNKRLPDWNSAQTKRCPTPGGSSRTNKRWRPSAPTTRWER